MKKVSYGLLCALLFSIALPAIRLAAQEREQAEPDSEFGSKFFDQLRTIFGTFRDSDLQRVFEDAKPIQCSELAGRKGEWRQVAFFNEDRSLGDWCRQSMEEVKSDLSVFTFTGACSGDQGDLQVATEFPTDETVEAYNQRRISTDDLDIMANDPVKAVVDPKTRAYTFDLPYLFLKSNAPRKVYSFIAPDRNTAYAREVASRWECKAVSSKDVTYRFLICRVGTVPAVRLPKGEKWERSFGSSAYFILSDGTEAHTHVNLTFGDAGDSGETQGKSGKAAELAPTSNPGAPPRPVLKRK
jgi:hypothetical protein